MEPRIFISYGREDLETARQLYNDLKGAGLDPWIDDVDLLPGQNWRQTINRAIKESRYVLTLLSSKSLSKRGYAQKELKKALDVLDEFPSDEIFVIPVRIDECKMIDERLEGLHWVDLFPSYKDGLERILRTFQAMGESVEEDYVPHSDEKETGGSSKFSINAKNIQSVVQTRKISSLTISSLIEKYKQSGTLVLDRDQVMELPFVVEQLGEIDTLVVSSNELVEIPNAIGRLNNLKEFICSNNRLNRIPLALCHLSKLHNIDLSNNQFDVFPKVLTQLPELRKLDIGSNQITVIPEEYGYLTNLTSLDISGNQLSEFPKTILNFNKLETLIINNNHLFYIPSTIQNLKHLVRLEIRGNYLETIPSDIGNLKALQKLDLDNNRIKLFPAPIEGLLNLRLLDISNNRIEKLPDELGLIFNLQELRLNNNNISNFPEEIGKLTNLKTIEIRQNQLTNLPHTVTKLTNLERLDTANNKLTEIPEEIGKLENLRALDLRGNKITELPDSIGQLKNLGELYLEGNPLPIPSEILKQSYDPAEIINYYLQHKNDLIDKLPLNEAKMLVVGQASVGKTSLIRNLLGEKFNEHENSTKGICVSPWSLEVNNIKIKFNIWDFGGQEIMHATHQFFLTKRSLYVLLLDSRLDEKDNRLYYWLKIIESFGGDAPIIIACNKCDQRYLDLDWKGLQKKYPSIAGFAKRVSCKTGEGVNDVKKLIANCAGKLEHIKDKLLKNWIKVKRQLEIMDQDYISYREYQSMCEKKGVSDKASQRTLLSFLHDLGIILHFRDFRYLENTNVLNPEWVTKGIYQILNSNQLFQNKGILNINDIDDILDPNSYPREKQDFIIEVMRQFQLCFELENNLERRLLIPDLLQKEATHMGNWDNDCLNLQYHYNILPSSVISRFIVLMHHNIYERTYWRYGVLLKFADGSRENLVLVQSDMELDVIKVSVKGNEKTRRECLRIVRENIDKINSTNPKIEVKIKIPIPNHPEVLVDYNHLLFLEGKGEIAYWPEGLNSEISIKQLLDGIIPEKQRISLRETKNIHNQYELNKAENLHDHIRLLHLSDLHISKNSNPTSMLQPLFMDLEDPEDGLGLDNVNILVVTGDITNSARPEEFEKANIFIQGVMDRYNIPDECIIIAPGNHDLSWDENVYEWRNRRRVDIDTIEQSKYLEAGNGLLIRRDDIYPLKFSNFSKFFKTIKRIEYPMTFEDQCIPFLCPTHKILIMSMNSCWEIDEFFQTRSNIHIDALVKGLQKADKMIEDAKNIGQIPKDDSILKIAAWHHPVTGNEKIKNEGFLELLQQAGYKLCLHGHVHQDLTDLIGYWNPTNQMHVLGAGSFDSPGTNRPDSIPRLYNVMEIRQDHTLIRVHTRCKRRETGAWAGWAVWPGGEHTMRTYYDIDKKI